MTQPDREFGFGSSTIVNAVVILRSALASYLTSSVYVVHILTIEFTLHCNERGDIISPKVKLTVKSDHFRGYRKLQCIP